MNETILIIGIVITTLSLLAITTFTISNFILERIKKSENVEITVEQKRNEKLIKRILKLAKKVIKKVNKSLLQYYYAFYIVGALSVAGGTAMVVVSSNEIAKDNKRIVDPTSSSEPASSIGATSIFTYSITWKNYDGSTLSNDNVEVGVTPTYQGQTPTKPSTDTKVYVFDGWEPAIIAANSDATYTAKYIEQERKYTVTYKDDEDNIFRVDQVLYGTLADYGEDPTKDATPQYTYEFVSWNRAFEAVTSDTTYVVPLPRLQDTIPLYGMMTV